MQHHHSLVSRSLQPSIDSLPSISDLSLNLISFSPPTSPEDGCGPRKRRWCLSGCVLLGVRGSVFAGAQFSGRAQVNKVPNQLFIISNVILSHLIVNPRPFMARFLNPNSVTTRRLLQARTKCTSRPFCALLLPFG